VETARFCLMCGTRLQPRLHDGRERPTCPGCGFVLWPDPKLATAVVVEAAGGIVIGRRAIEPGYGEWCLPGGFVDDDEHPAQAAVRECREEIGAEVEILDLLGVYHVRRMIRPHLVALGYRARLRAGAEPSPGEEMLELGVFEPGRIPRLAFPSHVQVVSDWLRIGEYGMSEET